MSHTRSDQSMDGHSVWMKEIKTLHQHWRPPLLRSPAFFRCLTVKLKAAAVLANPCLYIASPYGRSRSPIWRTHVTRWHWQKNSHEARKIQLVCDSDRPTTAAKQPVFTSWHNVLLAVWATHLHRGICDECNGLNPGNMEVKAHGKKKNLKNHVSKRKLGEKVKHGKHVVK